VSMVEMALDQLSAKHIVELDEERKAAMVSNLLVVLCSDRDAQPSSTRHALPVRGHGATESIPCFGWTRRRTKPSSAGPMPICAASTRRSSFCCAAPYRMRGVCERRRVSHD